mmetsp:Transcript_32555/g.92326  ORF Transcript_32555/g.92326 Transcript_32555/m.92326 type:complete len:200 (-) Transcript_32555:227-826(-)
MLGRPGAAATPGAVRRLAADLAVEPCWQMNAFAERKLLPGAEAAVFSLAASAAAFSIAWPLLFLCGCLAAPPVNMAPAVVKPASCPAIPAGGPVAPPASVLLVSPWWLSVAPSGAWRCAWRPRPDAAAPPSSCLRLRCAEALSPPPPPRCLAPTCRQPGGTGKGAVLRMPVTRQAQLSQRCCPGPPVSLHVLWRNGSPK